MSEYITKSTVKTEYGLTDSMLKELGEPDKIAPNPHYRSSAPMQLYLRERVEKWIAENAERVEKVLKRRKPKAEKTETLLDVAKAYAMGQGTMLFRQSQRQVGDKWSWSVYDNVEHQVMKTGWASSEEEAKEICRNLIRTAKAAYK
jgi:XPA protein C-terminus